MERQPSTDITDSFKEPDTDSNDGSFTTTNSTSGRRASVTTNYAKHQSRPSYLTLGKGVDDKRRTTTMRFPAVPSAFPKAPTSSGGASFPVVPESPPPPDLPTNGSEKSQSPETFRRVT